MASLSQRISSCFHGTITGVTAVDNTFGIDGTTVQLTPDTMFENGTADTLKAGTLVEVDGFFRPDGVFAAVEIEFLSPS